MLVHILKWCSVTLFLVLNSTIYSFLSLDFLLVRLDYMWTMKTRTLYFFFFCILGRNKKKLHLLVIASLNIHINEQSLASPNFSPLALLPPHSLSFASLSFYFATSSSLFSWHHPTVISSPLCIPLSVIFYYPAIFKIWCPQVPCVVMC